MSDRKCHASEQSGGLKSDLTNCLVMRKHDCPTSNESSLGRFCFSGAEGRTTLVPQRALNPRKGPLHGTPTRTAAPPPQQLHPLSSSTPQLTSLIHSQRQGELCELNRCASARRAPDLGKLCCVSQPHASFDEHFDVIQSILFFKYK